MQPINYKKNDIEFKKNAFVGSFCMKMALLAAEGKSAEEKELLEWLENEIERLLNQIK